MVCHQVILLWCGRSLCAESHRRFGWKPKPVSLRVGDFVVGDGGGGQEVLLVFGIRTDSSMSGPAKRSMAWRESQKLRAMISARSP